MDVIKAIKSLHVRIITIVAYMEGIVLIIQELTPAVAGSCQHIIEGLVILYQIGENVIFA